MNKENLVFRLDGRIEYECEHDVGHPVYSPDGDYLHGCCTDRCCENYNLVFPKDFED
ncbi:hypothetical protein HOG16_04875 [Candidatus Woesearchaeota archaeon]|nr:hypothetical protein [Candidatus Woesearchaeota archaeon]MBT4321743.1 hypothetical protein [Candidatus Woesearchaeota archaeon]MBT4631165.1 hypothetical protein [Candidatus Woesearchaeota archaeon]